MSAENPSWGQERIANELMPKLGIQVSPRTVRKYLNTPGPNRQPDPKQRWLTFVRNHANAIVASDFFVVVTAQFRILYVFVCIELGTRRILHYNVTAHPTAEWTLQQFRETLAGDHSYRFVLHDQDSIFSRELDQKVTAMGVRVLQTPVRAPKANSICERFGGTLRRECLDFFIPLNEHHLKLILKPWVAYFDHARPHMSLGPRCRRHCISRHRRAPSDTAFQRVTSSGVTSFWADSIVSIRWRWQHERRCSFCGTQRRFQDNFRAVPLEASQILWQK